jgi:hypothetical protein
MIGSVGNGSNIFNEYFLNQKYGVRFDRGENNNQNNQEYEFNLHETGENQNNNLIDNNNLNIDKKEKQNNINKKEKDKGADGLTEKERKEVKELKETDKKVRQHEQAHMMAGAGLIISGAQFEYKRGPDGQLYAVAGEVTIDTSEVPNNPEATLEKAKKIQRAALAPQDPSPQDRQVAAKARQMENKARTEIMKKRQKEMEKTMKTEKSDFSGNFKIDSKQSISDRETNIINNSYTGIQSPTSNSINFIA